MSTTSQARPESGPRVGSTPARTVWWRRPWVGPLALVVAVFLILSLPRYLTFDPALSRVPAPSGFPAYYPILVTHVLLSSVAIVACCFQVWPSFRQRLPRAHRWIGRTYVSAVLPASVMAVVLGVGSPFGPMAQVSNVMLGVLWFTCTVAGFRAARARQFGEHRKWMIRGFALTLSIVSNRIWGVVFAIALAPQLDTTFGGNETFLMMTVAGLTTWVGWTVPLLIAEWWLSRPQRRHRSVAQK